MKKHNFTLIEIMGVIALIVMLLVISIGAYNYAMDSSKEKSTRASVARIGNALQLLQDRGLLAITTGITDNKNGFVKVKIDIDNKKLIFNNAEIGKDAAGQKEIFNRFMKSVDGSNIESIMDDDKFLTDGWGQTILIRFPGKFNRGGFDIISAGSDGAFGKDAAENPSLDINDYRDSSDNEWICDDITNF